MDTVRGWYGRFGEFVTGMAIRELTTSAQLAMPFTNVREWSGPLESVREWTRFVGSTEQLDTSRHIIVQYNRPQVKLPMQRVSKVLAAGQTGKNCSSSGELRRHKFSLGSSQFLQGGGRWCSWILKWEEKGFVFS